MQARRLEQEPEKVTVRLYENLFKSKTCSPSDAAPGDSEAWLRDVNYESKQETVAMVDPSVLEHAKPLAKFQFERIGYFVVDIESGADSDNIIMNRTLPLKTKSW